jgi:hypothetical protein
MLIMKRVHFWAKSTDEEVAPRAGSPSLALIAVQWERLELILTI